MYSGVIVKPRRNIFAVLDIGTTKIICLTVKVTNNSKWRVIGAGYKIAEGISGGSIIDAKQASYSISSTVNLAEQVSEETIDQVHAEYTLLTNR